MAILNVNPGRMPEFLEGLSSGYKIIPIIACWRPIAGNPNEVIDLWKDDILWKKENTAYSPFTQASQWIRDLRDNAIKERIVAVYTLPYSPLK